MLTKFDELAQKAIVISESIAFDLGHSNVGSEHLLLGLLRMPDIKVKEYLSKYEVTQKVIEDDIKRLFGCNDDQPFYMEYSEEVKQILDNAIELANKKNIVKVNINVLAIALFSQKDCVAYEMLRKYEVDTSELLFLLNENTGIETKLDSIDSLVNLNKKVKNKDYEIVGRQKEVEAMCSILSKKEKNNVLIIGQAGVGKSALVEKLAFLINKKQVIKNLQNKIIYELSLSSIVSGTKYRGEFEEKLRKIIDKVKEMDNIILFIDEIHNIIGAGGAEGAIDASNILKPYLARKDITVIGATTTDEYYRHFEKDQAMNRRFSLVLLQENTKEETLEILMKVKKYYEKYHDVIIPSSSLKYLIDQVDLYIKNRTFPDKAIDILDLSCVKGQLLSMKRITKKVIDQVIEEYTSVNITKAIDYNRIEKELKKVIIGQDKPITDLIKQIKDTKVTSLPLGVYLLVGKNGVGKSECIKQLASLLNRNLITLDMNTYKDSSSINKLIGSPPGYVGYDKSSILLDKLYSYPKSIIVLDNIDKAHSDVINIFIQVFNEGYLEDNQKRKIYFNNSYIFLTTNNIIKDSSIGFTKNKRIKNNLSNDLLNKVDNVIYFNDLDINSIRKIIKQRRPSISMDQVNKITKNYNLKVGARGIPKSIVKGT